MSEMPDTYLKYAHRRYGMDHDRYEWSMLQRRPGVAWPNGSRIALWIVPALEWFPLDMKGQPFKPPGAMQTAYPDLRHYTLRDYGNRVGIFRVMDALARHSIPASVAINAAVAVRYPSLMDAVLERGWEILGHGLDMDHLHHGGLAEEDERRLIAQSLDVLQKAAGAPVRGWLSPAKSESSRTPDLLAEAGIEYLCDWVNDDMPYAMRTRSGRTVHAMPHSADIDDYSILVNNHHTEDDFRDALIDHFDTLYKEASPGNGRVMSVSLHPWIIGQPYRIRCLEEALSHIMKRPGVWPATGGQILDEWVAHQNRIPA